MKTLYLFVALMCCGMLAKPAYVAQNEHKGPPCDNLESTPPSHRCHCYDMEQGDKCPSPDNPNPHHGGPDNWGHDTHGNEKMGNKCKHYCATEKCQCADSCAS